MNILEHLRRSPEQRAEKRALRDAADRFALATSLHPAELEGKYCLLLGQDAAGFQKYAASRTQNAHLEVSHARRTRHVPFPFHEIVLQEATINRHPNNTRGIDNIGFLDPKYISRLIQYLYEGGTFRFGTREYTREEDGAAKLRELAEASAQRAGRAATVNVFPLLQESPRPIANMYTPQPLIRTGYVTTITVSEDPGLVSIS